MPKMINSLRGVKHSEPMIVPAAVAFAPPPRCFLPPLRVFGVVGAAVVQVWSITQFYSVDFSQSTIGVKKCVFNKNAQSRLKSAVVDGVLGPPSLVSTKPDCDLVSL